MLASDRDEGIRIPTRNEALVYDKVNDSSVNSESSVSSNQ